MSLMIPITASLKFGHPYSSLHCCTKCKGLYGCHDEYLKHQLACSGNPFKSTSVYFACERKIFLQLFQPENFQSDIYNISKDDSFIDQVWKIRLPLDIIDSPSFYKSSFDSYVQPPIPDPEFLLEPIIGPLEPDVSKDVDYLDNPKSDFSEVLPTDQFQNFINKNIDYLKSDEIAGLSSTSRKDVPFSQNQSEPRLLSPFDKSLNFLAAGAKSRTHSPFEKNVNYFPAANVGDQSGSLAYTSNQSIPFSCNLSTDLLGGLASTQDEPQQTLLTNIEQRRTLQYLDLAKKDPFFGQNPGLAQINTNTKDPFLFNTAVKSDNNNKSNLVGQKQTTFPTKNWVDLQASPTFHLQDGNYFNFPSTLDEPTQLDYLDLATLDFLTNPNIVGYGLPKDRCSFLEKDDLYSEDHGLISHDQGPPSSDHVDKSGKALTVSKQTKDDSVKLTKPTLKGLNFNKVKARATKKTRSSDYDKDLHINKEVEPILEALEKDFKRSQSIKIKQNSTFNDTSKYVCAQRERINTISRKRKLSLNLQTDSLMHVHEGMSKTKADQFFPESQRVKEPLKTLNVKDTLIGYTEDEKNLLTGVIGQNECVYVKKQKIVISSRQNEGEKSKNKQPVINEQKKHVLKDVKKLSHHKDMLHLNKETGEKLTSVLKLKCDRCDFSCTSAPDLIKHQSQCLVNADSKTTEKQKQTNPKLNIVPKKEYALTSKDTMDIQTLDILPSIESMSDIQKNSKESENNVMDAEVSERIAHFDEDKLNNSSVTSLDESILITPIDEQRSTDEITSLDESMLVARGGKLKSTDSETNITIVSVDDVMILAQTSKQKSAEFDTNPANVSVNGAMSVSQIAKHGSVAPENTSQEQTAEILCDEHNLKQADISFLSEDGSLTSPNIVDYSGEQFSAGNKINMPILTIQESVLKDSSNQHGKVSALMQHTEEHSEYNAKIRPLSSEKAAFCFVESTEMDFSKEQILVDHKLNSHPEQKCVIVSHTDTCHLTDALLSVENSVEVMDQEQASNCSKMMQGSVSMGNIESSNPELIVASVKESEVFNNSIRRRLNHSEKLQESLIKGHIDTQETFTGPDPEMNIISIEESEMICETEETKLINSENIILPSDEERLANPSDGERFEDPDINIFFIGESISKNQKVTDHSNIIAGHDSITTKSQERTNTINQNDKCRLTDPGMITLTVYEAIQMVQNDDHHDHEYSIPFHQSVECCRTETDGLKMYSEKPNDSDKSIKQLQNKDHSGNETKKQENKTTTDIPDHVFEQREIIKEVKENDKKVFFKTEDSMINYTPNEPLKKTSQEQYLCDRGRLKIYSKEQSQVSDLKENQQKKSDSTVVQLNKKTEQCHSCEDIEDHTETNEENVLCNESIDQSNEHVIGTQTVIKSTCDKIPEEMKVETAKGDLTEIRITCLNREYSKDDLNHVQNTAKKNQAIATSSQQDEMSETPHKIKSSDNPTINDSEAENKTGTYMYCGAPGCEYSTTHSGNLSCHRRTHTGYKPLLCDKCPFVAADTSALKRHIQLNHLKEKRFRCSQCDYLSLFRVDIVKHYKNTHLKQKLYACNKCQYRTGYTHSLKYHLMAHAGIRPYKCSACSYQVISSNKVARHIRVKHAGEPDIKCEKLDLTFEVNAKEFQCEETISDKDIKVIELSEYEIKEIAEKNIKETFKKETKVKSVKVKCAKSRDKVIYSKTKEKPVMVSLLGKLRKDSNDMKNTLEQLNVTVADTSNEKTNNANNIIKAYDNKKSCGEITQEQTSATRSHVDVGLIETVKIPVTSDGVERYDTSYQCCLCSFMFSDVDEIRNHLLKCKIQNG